MIDITGQKFGEWTVGEAFKKPNGRIYYHCTCSCGTKRDIYGSQLRRGKTHSCGCLGASSKLSSLSGRRFGHLEAVEPVVLNHRTFWRCKCDCGGEKLVSRSDLLNGVTQTCGCNLGKGDNIRAGLEKYLDNGTYIPGLNRSKPNKNNTSGVTGVNYRPERGKYRAYIKFQRKNIHLGTFDTFEEAVAARKAGELKYFGKYQEVMANGVDTSTD